MRVEVGLAERAPMSGVNWCPALDKQKCSEGKKVGVLEGVVLWGGVCTFE